MLSAVSDFSGLDGFAMAPREESQPAVTRFFQAPEFPELLPEVRAELEEIQAAMDVARAEREAQKTSASVAGAVSAEVERVVQTAEKNSDVKESFFNAPRETDFRKLRQEFFNILSSDVSFPPYHAKVLLDLCAKIESGTPESELAQVGNVLIYLVENLGTHYDKERYWEERQGRYVAASPNAAEKKPKFRIRPLAAFSRARPEPLADAEEARAAFDADYVRKGEKFVSKFKANGSVSQDKFRADFSGKEYGSTASRCFEAGLELWKDIYMETAAIKAQLNKIHGAALIRKIEKIRATFDWSDLERMEELEAASTGNYALIVNKYQTGRNDGSTADSAFSLPGGELDGFSKA